MLRISTNISAGLKLPNISVLHQWKKFGTKKKALSWAGILVCVSFLLKCCLIFTQSLVCTVRGEDFIYF